MNPGDFFEQRANLPFETLRRADCDVGGQARGRRIIFGERRDLDVPAWRNRAEQPRQAAVLLAVLQAVEYFQDGQICFRSGQPLRAASAAHAHDLAAIFEQLDESVEDRRLANPRLGREKHDAPLAAFGPLELMQQRVHLEVASDDRAARPRRSLCDGHRR